MSRFIKTLTIVVFAIGILSCSNEGSFRSDGPLENTLQLTESSKRTVAIMAVGQLPAGAIGVGVDDAIDIFATVSGIGALRELLRLLAVVNPNGTLGADYINTVLTFAVVDGARVLTLSFLGRTKPSTDTLSTINSTARSHRLDVEAISESESKISNSANREDFITVSIDDQSLSLRHARTGAWPEPNATELKRIHSGLHGDGTLVSLTNIDLGEFGRILGAGAQLPWTPPTGSTLSIGTFIAADGQQTTKGRLHIPELRSSLTRCSQLKAKNLIINGPNLGTDSDVFVAILNPQVACLLGATNPGYIHLRWKVSTPVTFNLLAPFDERTVSRNVPDSWPGKTPQASYSKECEGVLVYNGELPTCARAADTHDLIEIHAPAGFIKRLFTGTPPEASEFFRLMRLYQDTPAKLRASLDGDDIVIELK